MIINLFEAAFLVLRIFRGDIIVKNELKIRNGRYCKIIDLKVILVYEFKLAGACEISI